jgi:hypothetical protein
VTKTVVVVVVVQARNINKSHGETKSEDDDYIFLQQSNCSNGNETKTGECTPIKSKKWVHFTNKKKFVLICKKVQLFGAFN